MPVSSPLGELQYLGDTVALPSPRYPIGTCLNLRALDPESQHYYFMKAVKDLIRDTRAITTSLQKEGYFKEMRGKKLLPDNKAAIREKIDMLRLADSVEIAGYKPEGMHVTGTIGNQCYLRNGQCHSGVSYTLYLLFRRTLAGNRIVYIHPYPVIHERYLKNLVIPSPASA